MRLAKMAELRGAFVYAVVFSCVLMNGVACKDDDDADHDDDGEHGEHGDHEHDVSKMIGPLTGATCPANSTLMYDDFGKQFFTKYCNGCHAESVKGDARKGAPADHTFDTLADIALLAPHIDQYAGSGPDSTNEHMPPATDSGPKPSKEERQKLSEWLACDAP